MQTRKYSVGTLENYKRCVARSIHLKADLLKSIGMIVNLVNTRCDYSTWNLSIILEITIEWKEWTGQVKV